MVHAWCTVTVENADATWRIYHGDEVLTEVARTTTKSVARFKVRKPEPPGCRAAGCNIRTPPTARCNPEHVKPSQPITVQIYCRLTVTIHDPQAVTNLAAQHLRDAEIDWSAEGDDLETAAEELRGDLLNSLAYLAEPDRMLAEIPGVSPRGGRIWAEQGDPHPRFQPGFQDPG